MKLIIALWHTENRGKTSTLRELANLILREYENIFIPIFPIPVFIPTEGDLRLIIEVNGKIIGIDSEGDPYTDLNSRLIELTDTYNCDIIFCCTRTKGETVNAVENLWKKREFNVIWTSTYQTEDNHDFFNRTKALHLLDLVQSLGQM